MNNHLSPQELRRIGRILKIARESQGQNLAILADKCNLSVMDLVAVESGEQSQLMKRGHKWPDCAMLYAKQLDVDIGALTSTDLLQKESKDIGSVEDESDIPLFLRKQRWGL